MKRQTNKPTFWLPVLENPNTMIWVDTITHIFVNQISLNGVVYAKAHVSIPKFN